MTISALAKKLHIRPGYTVALLDAPEGALEMLAPLPDDVKVVTDTKEKVDFVLLFVTSSVELEKQARALKEILSEDVVLWFAYPKLSSKVRSDLTRDRGWQPIYAMGYQGVASIAIDSTWSGVRFRPGTVKPEGDEIAAQYTGARVAFLPIYEKIAAIAQGLGNDVKLVPRQSYVAFVRGKQFALVKPSRDRLDLALKLPDAPQHPRLESAAGVGSGSMTHRVVITNAADVDEQVKGWLEAAYQAAGK